MSEVLETLSGGLADVVDCASKAVVRVEGRRRLAATGIVWSEDGLILTANHVVKRESGLIVGLASGEQKPAEVVGMDPTTDLAVLRVKSNFDGIPAWVADDDLRVGHIVLALGRPGASIQATLGVVSALGSHWRTPAGGELTHYLQTDVVMYPGFSGGPLVSAAGDFIGLNTSALVRGVSLTVSTSSLKSIAQELIDHGQVRRGYLGINLQIVRLPDGISAELGQKTGLLIAGIEGDSPASQSDLFQGDILISAGDAQLRHMDDLFIQLNGDRIGTQLPLTIVRAGEVKKVEVRVGTREG